MDDGQSLQDITPWQVPASDAPSSPDTPVRDAGGSGSRARLLNPLHLFRTPSLRRSRAPGAGDGDGGE